MTAVILFQDVVFPEFQNKGKGLKIVEDIKSNIFGLYYGRIEVGINDDNVASLKLFKKQRFVFNSKDGGLINLIYENRKSKSNFCNKHKRRKP